MGYNPADLFKEPDRWGFRDGKKIWLPRGIVIPGISAGQVRYVKVHRPQLDDH
jgi:hypothetical protein